MSHAEIEERVIESYEERFGRKPSLEQLQAMVEEIEWYLDETFSHALGAVIDTADDR